MPILLAIIPSAVEGEGADPAVRYIFSWLKKPEKGCRFHQG